MAVEEVTEEAEVEASGAKVVVDGVTLSRVGPRLDAWFGTDIIGRDVFARVIYGARPILITAVIAAKAAVGAAVLIGGFRAVSDDDFARVVLAQQWAAHPTLDPTGTSWLPVPFWP